MPPDPHPTRRLREVFLEAAEIDDVPARAVYLDEACRGDSDLRRRVEALLSAESEAGGPPLEPPSAGPGGGDPVLGSRISHYKLLQQIGEGGCGIVYMAEQEQPVRRKVAVKIIKRGMDTTQVVARFEAERQALAMMEHPNIARVFDAGAIPIGPDRDRPYFVMELVRGIPITDYCDEHTLSIRQRLELFMQVCHAVQHAHQRGIIHRDLKPSNVLVTEVDSQPVPKVIDFGIAKAVDGRLTDKTVFTAFEQLVGTPSYMSPEQASLASAGIDTRTDVYSLGVMLYQLLTGETPFDTKLLLAAGVDEMRRTLRERVPAKPSNRLTTLRPDQIRAAARARGSEPARFPNLLSGDLDWIVMKCLEKDRGRRYESADALAVDVQRHLDHEPIFARPPSRLYEFQKAVRRHWVGFAATAAVILSLAAGMVATSRQATRASNAERQAVKERDRARTAEEQAARERDQAQLLAATAAMEKGQTRLEKGDSFGLFDLVESYRLAEHAPRFRETVGRRWSVWHQEWARRTIAVRPSWGLPSPDHLMFATVSDWPPANDSAVIEIHDTLTGDRIAGPLIHGSVARGGAFSPNGRRLATVTANGVIHLWDCKTGQPLRSPCETGVPGLNKLLFDAGGRFMVAFPRAGTGLPPLRTAVLVRLDDRDGPAQPLEHGYAVRDARFSPDGDVLAVLCPPEVQLWRTEDLRRLGPPIAASNSGLLEFNEDGSLLAICPPGSRGVRLLNPATQKTVGEYPVTGSKDTAAAGFSHAGDLLATCNWDGTLKLWRAGHTNEPYLADGFRERMYGGFTFNPEDTMIAVGDAEGTTRVIDAGDGRSIHALRTRPFATAKFLSNGVLAVSASGQVAWWDLTATPLRSTVLPHDALASTLAFDPSGERLAVGSESELRLWRIRDSPRLEHSIPMRGEVLSVVFSAAEERFVAFTEDGSLTSIDPRTGSSELMRRIKHGYELRAELSPDARRLALYHENAALVVDVPTGESHWLDNDGGILSMAFRRESRSMAVGMASWRVCLYDLGDQGAVPQGEVSDLGGWVYDVAFHPSGQVLAATVEEKVIRLIDRDGLGRSIRGCEPSLAKVKRICFSPDGKLLAAAGPRKEGGHGIELWHMDRQRGLNRGCSTLPCEQPIWSLEFSPDSRTLAAGGLGCTRLWHLPVPPTSLEQVENQTWTTIGFQLDENKEPVLVRQPGGNNEQARARVTQAAGLSIEPLDAALNLSPAEALTALQALTDQESGNEVYRQLQGFLRANLVVANLLQGDRTVALANANEITRLGYGGAYAHFMGAFLSLAVGDTSAYKARCREMAARYQSSTDPAVSKWLAYATTLQPGAIEDYAPIISRMRDAVRSVADQDAPAYRFYLGSALARAGHYAEAATELEQVRNQSALIGTLAAFNQLHVLLLLSICHAHLGHVEKSREFFEAASADAQNFVRLNQELTPHNVRQRLILEWLQIEATAALKSRPAQSQ